MSNTKRSRILTDRQSTQYRHCRLANSNLYEPAAKAGRKLQVAEADPELVAIVQACSRYPEGHEKAGKPLPAVCDQHSKKGCEDWHRKRECSHAQRRNWCHLRDTYAAKNYNLPWRAAQLQWKVNQHLEGEQIRCLFCPGKPLCQLGKPLNEKERLRAGLAKMTGAVRYLNEHFKLNLQADKLIGWEVVALLAFHDKHKLRDGRCSICLTGCNRCHNTGHYVTQPDLEALAYSGLLEAIRLCDFSKGGMKISTYAVWLMKQAMMPLLRQTPVFFPQELLRDRRIIRDLKKKLEKEEKREPVLAEIHAALHAVRKCKQIETLEERRLLAEGCYYGQEKSSVEELHAKHIERSDRSEKKQRKGKSTPAVESLCVRPHDSACEENLELEELQAVLKLLPADKLKLVQRFLKGRAAEVPAELLDELRARL